MTGDQLALPTAAMSLQEVVADHCDPFDEVIRRLEDQALEEAQLDDDSQPITEFYPLVGDRVEADGWEWLGNE
jgi:hypothetical protein